MVHCQNPSYRFETWDFICLFLHFWPILRRVFLVKQGETLTLTAVCAQTLSDVFVSPSDSPDPPDCLLLQVFKDKSDRAPGSRERTSVTLEEICGLEAGRWYEGVAFTLAIVCLNQAAVLGFDSKEALLAWDARLRYSLGEGEEKRRPLKECPLILTTFDLWSSCHQLQVRTSTVRWAQTQS